MNLPVRHNGALGAFCTCESCLTEIAQLPTANPTASRAPDPLELAMLNDGLLATSYSADNYVLEAYDCGYVASAGGGPVQHLADPEAVYESPLTVVDDAPRPARPVEVYDLDAARRQAMPRENREHVADMLLEGTALGAARIATGQDGEVWEPQYLGTFRGQVAQLSFREHVASLLPRHPLARLLVGGVLGFGLAVAVVALVKLAVAS